MFWFALRSGYCSTTSVEPAQRAIQRLLSGRQLLHRRRVAGIGLRSGQAVHRGAARRDDGLQGLALVRHVGLGRLDQVGNQVEAAPQLNIDLREGVLVGVARADQAVVAGDHEDGE